MKRLTRPAVLIAIAIMLTIGLTAQTNSPNLRAQGYHTFGLNGGIAYQQSDVLTDFKGFGFGMTYGKNLLYSPTSPLNLDLRTRFQIDQTFGRDVRPSYGLINNEALNGDKTLDYTGEEEGGLVYANHKTNRAELGVEAVVGLNGLREKTGVGVSLTAGLGLAWYKAMIDQSNANGLYTEQYKTIDPDGPRSYGLSQIKGFQDGKFETEADGINKVGNIGIMPSLGIELDYDLTPNLAVGLGHRMTFSNTDVLDGQRWTNSNALTGENDALHYTSLGFKYTFNGKNKVVRTPKIEIIEPYGNGLNTNKASVFIKAKIERVRNPFDVYLTINGEEQNFNFTNQILTTQARLQRGENRIMITATNESGSKKESFSLFYEDTNQPVTIPEINDFGTPDISFINPAYEGTKVESTRFSLRAKIRHVDTWKAIELSVNGQKERFDFDTDNETLDASINLSAGQNTIEIKAKNRDGERRLATNIIYQAPIPYPTAQFINPSYDNSEVDRDIATVAIALTGISQQSDIQLFANKNKLSNLYFDTQTGRLEANVLLQEGRNIIEVFANNQRGEVREQITINYRRAYVPTVRTPRVRINAPNYSQSTTTNEVVTIHATLTEINRKSDIRLTNNGQAIYDFQFNPNTGILTHNLYLRPGINQVSIEVQNEAGRDGASATINFELPLPPPPPPVVIVPNVEILRPFNNDVFDRQEIIIKANLIGVLDKRDIELRVNRDNCLDFNFNPSNGNFRAKIQLRDGENNISLKAINPAGVDKERLIVFYQRPVAPVIDIRQPRANRTENERIKLKVNIDYIPNKRDIQLNVNGRTIRNFEWANNQLEATIRLNEGRNEVQIIAKNEFGTKSELLEIDYFIPRPASVTFNKPTNEQTVKTKDIRIEAIVKNIKEKKDIRLFINGRTSGNFSFSGDKVTATIQLKKGINTIAIKADSKHGSDEEKIRITYRAAQLPRIDFVSHQDKTEVNERGITLKADFKNVAKKEAITLKVNGRTNNTFTFKEGTLRSPIRLEKGKNKILIKAVTEDGTVEETLTITYKSIVNQPVVKIMSPTKTNRTTQHTKIDLTASIDNVGSKRDLELLINGKSTTNFTWDNKSGELAATIPLKLGLNQITIRAKNEGGTVEQKTTVTQRLGRPTITKGGKIGKVGKTTPKGKSRS